jgi:DNA-binding NtrC family response regulator
VKKNVDGHNHILVIDDEPVICNGCELILAEHNYHVDKHTSGKAGLAKALSSDFDLILLDMKLPDLDGMKILHTLKTQIPNVAVIVMTGYSTVANAVQALKLGAYDYLAKPFSEDELINAVDTALENKQLKEENVALRQQQYAKFDFSNIVGDDPVLLQIFEEIRKVAPTDSSVLIEGESGTGKELFARAIHAHSLRSGSQFVAVDCSTFSTTLLESELFGHVKGAFTGALKDKAGIFEVANGGTLFLDEIGNLNIEVQSKLLRVMETHLYQPVGASHAEKTDNRLIAATNKNLKQMVGEGRFREDLYYRLSVLPIFLPPLRARKTDIPKLAYYFLRRFSRKMGKRVDGFSDEALKTLIDYDWPGNVRQLKNVVERLVILSDKRILDQYHLLNHLETKSSHRSNRVPQTWQELKELKRELIEIEYSRIERVFLCQALQSFDGNITQSAKNVGMQRSNFSALLKKHGIKAKDYSKQNDRSNVTP